MGDYEYLKYEPHSFGACKERNFIAKVKSSAWKEEEQRVTILGRKEGDEYKIYIPKILRACKIYEKVDCTVTVDLSEFIDIFFDLNYAFASTVVIYHIPSQKEYSFPAAAKLRNAEGKTFLSFLPNGLLPNENNLTINSEALFGIMGMTITINFNLFDMCAEVKEDYEESDEEEDDDIMTDDNEPDVPGEEEGGGGGDNPGDDGGGSGGGDNPGGGGGGGDDDDDFIGDDDYDSDDFINDDDYTGFLPTSVSEINELATTYSLPTNMKLKKVRWLVSCKAWEDEKFYVVGLAGVDKHVPPERGVIVVPDLYRNIGYSNTCEGSCFLQKYSRWNTW